MATNYIIFTSTFLCAPYTAVLYGFHGGTRKVIVFRFNNRFGCDKKELMIRSEPILSVRARVYKLNNRFVLPGDVVNFYRTKAR